MRTTKPEENRNKNFSRYLLTFLLSVTFTLNISAKNNTNSDTFSNSLNYEKHKLEKHLFAQIDNVYIENIEINEIEIIELEEEVEIGFDTSMFLPIDFNALKGKNDLDWNTIELIELEEEVEINFNVKAYLPIGFNPYKGIENIINQIDATIH